MKDLTHYFNSPSPVSKKPEASPTENESLADEKTPKMNKKVRKKRLKLDKLTPPSAEDTKHQSKDVDNNESVAEINVKNELKNGDTSFVENEVCSDTGSERKKKKRKLSPSCEDTSKRTKRKVAKGRLKIINVSSNSPEPANSQPEKPTDTSLAKDILVNSLVVDKLSSLIRDNDDFEDDDDGYEIEDDSDEDEDYSSKKVKRKKKKKRKSVKKKSIENGVGDDEAVSTPNGNEVLENTVEVEQASEKRNSLFKYYSKVDKNQQIKERMSEKIKVQALVHTPPSEKRRSASKLNDSTPSSAAKSSLRKKFSRLQKELMKDSDTIEVVSSEEIVQSSRSEVKLNGNCDSLKVDTNCETFLKDDTKKGVTDELYVKTVVDWKIKINTKLTRSDSVSTEDGLHNENESPNSKAKNASDTSSKDDFNKLLSVKRLRKPNPKYSETVDESETPTKTKKTKDKNSKRQSKLKISPPCPTIDVDESSNDSVCEARVVRESTSNRNLNKSAKISLNDKSAGLMAKFLGKSLVNTPKESVKKVAPLVDPSVLIARQKFLKSGLPDDLRQKIASQSEEVFPEPPPFPSVSHIQQRDPMRLIWNIPEPQLKLAPSPAVDLEVSDWQTLFADSQNDSSSEQSDSSEPIKKIKNKSFIKDFLRMKANTQLSINGRWALMRKLKSAGVESACWTDIYKPKSSGDILGNKSCVERFKVWLETYKNTAVKPTGDEGSSDEFVHSSDESSSMPQERICIISGPIGCGKTSAVYAVAQELGYKVLEVNASHNRNGKKVTADLSEATQSHQVEHGSLKDIFGNGRKVKKKKKDKSANKDVSSKKRSLILVEDADLLFEGCDEGFIPAIAALSLTSKRPMVFTVNNKKAQHFSKFVKPSDLMLEFQRPTSSNLASWLQLIAMSEGIHLDDNHADLLANWSNNDIRKSLVQLQFLAQSCEDTAKWPSYIHQIRFPSAIMQNDSATEEVTSNNKHDVTTKSDVINPSTIKPDDITSTRNDVSRTSKLEMIASLKSLAIRSDSLVVSDLLMTSSSDEASGRSREPRPELCVSRDSTALSESAALVARSGSQHTNCLAEVLLKHVGSCVQSDVRCPKKRWKSDNNLKTAVPLMVRCSHSTVYVDYLPTLRFLGQCEDLRLSAYTRRNRNFNYLQGLGVNTSEGIASDAFL